MPAPALWQKMYEGTFWHGRRGLGLHAIGALDIALHDLAGKQLGLPVHKLMGGARRAHLEPYCTIYPGLAHGRSIAHLMKEIGRQFDKALAIGFRAVRMEVSRNARAIGREATLKDGKMALPEGAGLGIALNDDLIDRVRVA